MLHRTLLRGSSVSAVRNCAVALQDRTQHYLSQIAPQFSLKLSATRPGKRGGVDAEIDKISKVVLLHTPLPPGGDGPVGPRLPPLHRASVEAMLWEVAARAAVAKIYNPRLEFCVESASPVVVTQNHFNTIMEKEQGMMRTVPQQLCQCRTPAPALCTRVPAAAAHDRLPEQASWPSFCF